MKSLRCLISLLGIVVSLSSIAAVQLTESFGGSSLDTAKWKTASPYSDSSIVVGNGCATSNNRGYLNSIGSFTGDVEINYMVKLTGSYTSADFYWKTDGSIMGQDRSCVVSNGLSVMLGNESQTLLVSQRQSYIGVIWSSVSVPVPLDTWISVRIVDQNGTVSVYLNGATTPTASIIYDPTNLVANAGGLAFCSRESQYCGPVGASITALSVNGVSTPASVVADSSPLTMMAKSSLMSVSPAAALSSELTVTGSVGTGNDNSPTDVFFTVSGSTTADIVLALKGPSMGKKGVSYPHLQLLDATGQVIGEGTVLSGTDADNKSNGDCRSDKDRKKNGCGSKNNKDQSHHIKEHKLIKGDSFLNLTLAPGTYTVVVSSFRGSPGIFELDISM